MNDDYLSPTFDPSSFTVPRLRSILIEHDINFPSSAKKAQLVQLFADRVTPQADEIRRSRSVLEPIDREPVRPTRRQTSIFSVAQENDDSVLQASRRASRRYPLSPRDDDHNSPRRPKSPTTISVDDESPFTQDNPFQSGSSPEMGSGRRSGDESKPQDQERSRRSSSRRTAPRGTINVVKDTSATYHSSYQHPKTKQADSEGEGIVAGEEFTPEQEMELVTERLANPARWAARGDRKRKMKSPGSVSVAVVAVLVAVMAGLTVLWRQDKLAVGYCGIGRPGTMLAGGDIPEWASFLRPQCEPCPPHAYCYTNLQTSCEPGFVLQPHPLSLGGLVPVPPTCEPDSVKARRAKAVADRAIEELRDLNAKSECGELKSATGKQAMEVEMDDQDLRKVIGQRRRKGMSQQEFEDLWSIALGDVTTRDEVVTGIHE